MFVAIEEVLYVPKSLCHLFLAGSALYFIRKPILSAFEFEVLKLKQTFLKRSRFQKEDCSTYFAEFCHWENAPADLS